MLPWFRDGRFPLYLAPMAGYTDVVYRELCKRHGADVLVSEFVLADSLVYGSERSWEMVDFSAEQRPMGVQIFGSSPAIMADAGRAIAERLQPDFVDLNFGCPSEKVTGRDAGSSMLRNPTRLQQVAKSVVDALRPYRVPVTAKLRLGWDERTIVARDVSMRLQAVGIEALAIHGRTKAAGYRGEADWDAIDEAARAVDIPVIGNGSIGSARDIRSVRRNTAVSGVMIGRAALGYPWIFEEIKSTLETGHAPPPPGLEQRWNTLI